MSRSPGPYSPSPSRRHFSASGYEDRHGRTSQQHFDPPPTSAYEDYDSSRDIRPEDRPYAPLDPRAHSFNQVTPYYDDILEAGSARSWEDQQAYTHRLPPPPSDYDIGRKPRPPARDRVRDPRHDGEYDQRYESRQYDGYNYRHRGSYDDRYRDDRSYDDRYDDDRSYDDRDRKERSKHRRRRSTEDDLKEKALGYPSDPKKGGRDVLGGSEGERGVAAKLIGGAGGALLGQTFGRGHTLETIAGAAVGAIAATAIEKQIEKRKEEKVVVRRSRDGFAEVPAGPSPQPGRDMRDVRETGRDNAKPGLRDRIRSLSRRGKRSLSRRRPSEDSSQLSEDRRRRSDSYDSVDSMRRERSR